MSRISGAIAASALALWACAPQAKECAARTGDVNVYSARHYDSDRILFDDFTCRTGVRVNLIEADGDALIERLSREGEASPADLFITADAGILWRAQSRDLFRPIGDEAIIARTPAQLRHPGRFWVGLSKRARLLIYSKEAGAPAGLQSYRDLAKPEFRGKVCARSSSNVYNQSLLASIIAHEGVAAAEAWAKGVVGNFAREPQGNDTSQIEAVAAGLCGIAIVNSYYVARYLDPSDKAKFEIGKKIGVIFPEQESRGTHVNISGAGVARHAPHPESAEKLIAFLLEDASQIAFARGNNEYPVVEGLKPQGPIAKLGAFKADSLGAAKLGENQNAAVRIFDRAGWK
jgi:iron(III) transport system substrate-binding protein